MIYIAKLHCAYTKEIFCGWYVYYFRQKYDVRSRRYLYWNFLALTYI